MGLVVLSLFDGMSCGQIALERAGIKVDKYYASEIDKYAIQVTQSNYPKTVQLGDITKLNLKKLPKIDLLIGGSPCQGFSRCSNGRLNFEDPRSKLFFNYVDILKELDPESYLLENVVMDKTCENLITDTLGRGPVVINSNLVSAQNRVRLYWSNILGITQPENKNIILKDILESEADEGFYSANMIRYARSVEAKNPNKKFKIIQLDSTDKFQCLTKSHSKGISRQRLFGIEDGFAYRYLTRLEAERLQTVPEGYTNAVSKTQALAMLGNGWTVDVIAHIFKGLAPTESWF